MESTPTPKTARSTVRMGATDANNPVAQSFK